MNATINGAGKRFTMALAVATTMAIAACGGGGGSSDTAAPAAPASNPAANNPSTPNTTPNPTVGATISPQDSTITLFAAPGKSAGTFAPSGELVGDSIGYMNNMRAQLGLPALKSNPAVAIAATNHSLYQQLNNSVGHYEATGSPGYTGYAPSDRVNGVYASPSVGEIAAGISGHPDFDSSTQAIDMLWDAPFHRAIIQFDTSGVGVGTALSADNVKMSTFTADFVDYVAFVPDNKLIAYPYAGQTNVKTQWQDNESPNPLAGSHPELFGKNVGYPVTLTAAGNGAYSSVSFVIKDPSGNAVDCTEVDSSNNEEATRLAMCVPTLPLAVNTTYTVVASGYLTNTTITTATPFAVTWSFTTASSNTSGVNTSAAASASSADLPDGTAGSAATVKAQTTPLKILVR